MSENRKSAARMRTYRSEGGKDSLHADGTEAMRKASLLDETAKHDSVRSPIVINTSSIPKDEYDRINAHRMPIATWIHDATRKHAQRKSERRHERIMKRARYQMRHPYARQHATAIAIVLAFAAVAVGGIAIGNSTVRNANTNTAANAADTTSTDSLTVSRTQRQALMATGLYDTFMLADGTPIAELLDGNVAPSDASPRKAILDESAAKVASESASSNEADGTSGSTDGNGTDANATPQGGLGNASGTLTSDQTNGGRQKVLDALNQYASNMQNATNKLSEQLNASSANGNAGEQHRAAYACQSDGGDGDTR